MAEGLENGAGSSWWTPWINAAKTKTSTVFEAVKKDLDELSTAVRTEASNVGTAIENTWKFDEEDSTVGTVKKSLSSFFGQVTEALVPSVEDEEVEAVLITHDGMVTLTGFQKHLAEVQSNDKTYLIEPDHDLVEKYKRWLEVVEQDQFTQNRLDRHLTCSEILNEKYTTLVPEKVSHMEFWKRYLFKRALLEDALANAEVAEKRAKAEVNSNKPVSPRKNIIQTEQPKLVCQEKDMEIAAEGLVAKDPQSLDKEILGEDINWEEEEIPSNVELSEEEQTRLLEQYEKEIQEREKRKSIVINDEVNNVVKNNGKTPSSAKQDQQQSTSNQKTGKQQNSADSKKTTKNAGKSQASAKQTEKTKGNNKSKSQQNAKAENLKLQKDHFKKDDTSSCSDESWEKDFDLNE